VDIVPALEAFYAKHERCGELDGGLEGGSFLDDPYARRPAGARPGVRL